MAHNLVPTVITDKNGKRTTVHKKAASLSTPSLSKVPPPSYEYPRAKQKEFLSGLFKEIDAENERYWNSFNLSRVLDSATNEELTILTDTLSAHPEFRETLSSSAAETNMRFSRLVSLAAIYHPAYADEPKPQRRMHLLIMGMEQSYARIKGTYLAEDWALGDEEPEVRDQAKRFSAAWYLLSIRAEITPSDELTDRLLDGSRTDHEATLEILRANPSATVEQIDFILNDGTASLSSGVL